MRRIGRVLVAIAVVIVLGATAFGVWANMVMPGDRSAALAVWRDPRVTVTSTDHSIVMRPANVASTTGLVFIPGAKVDPYAYMRVLADTVARGTTVVITKPTLNLAFFDLRSLSTFQADAPGISRWFVGGHSLGGVKACLLADDPTVTGLVLFGSYCANDLSRTILAVTSISGSLDGLSTPAKITDARHELPANAIFVEIPGADHASFGDYGAQPGDNPATISHGQARLEITAALAAALGTAPTS